MRIQGLWLGFLLVALVATGGIVIVLKLSPGDARRSIDEKVGMEVLPGGTVAQVVFEGVSLYAGRRRDEIPPIDQPVFASEPPNTAALVEDDWVVGLDRGGEARAYPLWVLSHREIVNDHFGSDPICVTYCPLSASAAAFQSRVDGREVSFGNEGGLFECNLVMYDRTTGSLWYQLRGVAIHGPSMGSSLVMVPAEVARWGDWRRRFPTGQVLVGDERTGRFFRVSEGGNGHVGPPPDSPEAPVSRIDPRLPVMERVAGFRTVGGTVCYPRVALEGLPEGRHAVSGVSGIWLVKGRDGGLRVLDGGEKEIPLIHAYWFAWHAAFPSGVLVSNRANP